VRLYDADAEGVSFFMQSNTSQPLFTIITSTLNAMDSVERCIESVSAQTFDNYEYIVVDGASTDGTAEFLNSHKELFSVLISEPDTGIYNAWNKALKHARGEWILFLGADDILADPEVLRDTEEFLKKTQASDGIVYGDLMLVSQKAGKDRERLHIPPEKIGRRSFLDLIPSIPPHPAVFHNKKVFSDFSFDESYRIAADSKLLLSVLAREKAPVLYFPRIINRMTVGGVSSKIGATTFFEELRLLRELKINIPFAACLWCFCKNYIKLFFSITLGDQVSYKLIDQVRRLKGKPKLWT
jgi:glycosyltransferase involved in cell wall biosynthesis